MSIFPRAYVPSVGLLGEASVKALACFKIRLFPLELSCKCSLDTLNNSPVSIGFLQIFSPVCSLSFHSLAHVLCRAEVFYFDEVLLINYSSHGW